MKSSFISWIVFVICLICLVPTKNIEPVALVVAISTDAGERNAYIELIKLEIDTRPLMGISDGKTAKNFYLIPGNKNPSELRNTLKSIKGIQQILIFHLSDPIKKSELAEVRNLFLQNKMDISGVSDDELSLYLNSQLKGNNTYVLHTYNQNYLTGISYMKLKTVSELLKNYKEDPNTKTTETTRYEGDIAISDISIEVSVEQPEPPPPPPVNFSSMSDAQMKNWYIKYDQNLKEEDIEIIRTPDEIIIMEKRNGRTGAMRYPINKNTK